MNRLMIAAALPCAVAVAVRALARHEVLRLALTLSVATGTLPAAAQTAARPSAPAPPNIVVFLVDDMGVMDTSVPFLTGEGGRPVRYPLNDYYRTPNMERLAARGIRFSTFMAMSVCSPTRISIMTGQNAARHRTTNWIDPAANNRDAQGPPDWNWRGLTKTNVTLPSALRAAGYRTIHVGKAHFGPNGSEGADPLNLGFDVNVGGRAIGHPGSYFGRDAYGKGGPQAVPHLERYHGTETFLTDALTNEAEARGAEAARLGEMMAALKGALERHGAVSPIGADGRALAPVLPRTAVGGARAAHRAPGASVSRPAAGACSRASSGRERGPTT